MVPATALAVQSGSLPSGAGLFLYCEHPDAATGRAWALRCQQYGIGFINLLINWAELEPHQGAYAFEGLAAFINAARDNGVRVVLRILTNSAWMNQSTPDWVFDSAHAAFRMEGGRRVPLPWDKAFLQAHAAMLRALGAHFAANGGPAAMHINLGGAYGEQTFAWEDYPEHCPDVDSWIATVGSAMVDLYADAILPVYPCALGVMLNNLTHRREPVAALLNHAVGRGVGFVQTNCSAAKLQLCDYGPDNARLMQYVAQQFPALRLVIEEEDGAVDTAYAGCPAIAAETVATRVSRLNDIESLYGIRFSAATLDALDLTSENADAILRISQRAP